MFTADTMFAMAYFTGDQMAPYVAAGTLSRALLCLCCVGAVMFQKSSMPPQNRRKPFFNLRGAGHGVLAICVRWGAYAGRADHGEDRYKSSYVAATTALLPWYAGAMVPLALRM